MGNAYADDAGIVSRSRNSLVKIMTVIVTVCTSFGSIISEFETETTCLMTKGINRVSFVTRQSAKYTINRQVCISWGNCVRECRPYRRDQPVRATG